MTISVSPNNPVEVSNKKPAIALLGILTAIDAIAIDSYIPALPAIGTTFRASATAVQATLSIFFVGVALGQAFWGPVSDRFGRRLPMLIGLIFYGVGSVVAVIAPDIFVLLIARFLQAIGASAGLVLARAIVSDLWPHDQAARLYSVMMQILGITALFSPLLGGGLLLIGSWRAIFGVMSLVGLASLLWTLAALPESLAAGRRQTVPIGQIFAGYVVLFKQPKFLWATATSAFAMGTMFALIAGSSFVFIRMLGWSSSTFSILYAITSIVFIGICQINNILLPRLGSRKLMDFGLLLQLGFALLFLGIVLFDGSNGMALAIVLTLIIGGLGIILGNAVSEAMQLAPESYGGTASAIVGVAQFALSAAIAPLAVALPNIALSVALMACLCAVIALVAARLSRPVSTRSRV